MNQQWLSHILRVQTNTYCNPQIRKSLKIYTLKISLYSYQLITDWIQQHGLNPNHQKTQLLIVSRSRKPTTHSISLNGHTLTPCSEVKYLGITINNDLTWSRHINNITKSTKLLLGRIHTTSVSKCTRLQYSLSLTTVVLFGTPTKLPTGLN